MSDKKPTYAEILQDHFLPHCETLDQEARDSLEFLRMRRVFAGSVLLAVSIGVLHDLLAEFVAWSALTWWEFIAVSCTLIFAAFFYNDLWVEIRRDKEGRNPKQAPDGVDTFYLANIAILNLIVIVAAIGFLFAAQNHHEGKGFSIYYYLYLSSVCVSYFLFVLMDKKFARGHRSFARCREYNAVLCYVDEPALIAFLILLLYTVLVNTFTQRGVSVEIIGGAAALQMLVANFIYLQIQKNVANGRFKEACLNCNHH